MKSRSSTALLNQLDERARENYRIVSLLRDLPDEALHRRPHPRAWTALEALEHLNIWSELYLDRTEKAIAASATRPAAEFTSTWLGNKFAAGMKPGQKTRKIPTLRKLNPKESSLDRSVIDTWSVNFEKQRGLLAAARHVDLGAVKIKTALSSLISTRLGDVLRMMVYHDWRHVEQAERATRGLAGIRVKEEVQSAPV